MKERKQELLKLIDNDVKLIPLVEEMLYLEAELDKLRVLPKLMIHPKDPTKQKTTPAAKLYKEFLQQYTNIVKVITKATTQDMSEEESPLRAWIRSRKDFD